MTSDRSIDDFEKDLITVPEAARRLELHPDTLYRLCRMGRFPPAVQIGASWKVSVPRLQRYLHAEVPSDPSISIA